MPNAEDTTFVNAETVVTTQRQSAIHRLLEPNAVLPGLAVFYTSLVWIPSAATAVLLLIGVHNWWIPAQACSAILFALLWFFLFRSLSRQQSLALATLVLCSIGLAACFSVFFYDMSFDGRWYHTDAILGLLQGVNPVYQQFTAPNVIYANHYPKATWYFAALVIHTFHNFQLGKIYNPILILASAAYAAHFFRQLGLHGGYAKLLVAATALNPIAASQLTTYYVDGAMGSLMSLTIMVIVNLILRAAALDRLLFVLVASLAISIKFTGGAYIAVGILVLFVAPSLFRLRKTADRRRVLPADIGSAAAALVLGFLVLGYDPYITNARQGLHPFYPLMGTNKVDLISGQLPVELKHRNPAQKFLISFFSETRGSHKTTLMNIPVSQGNLKIPFTVRPHELIAMGLADLRFAGWGIFFSGITVTSLALFIALKGWRGNAPILLGLALVTLTSFINPECWWARYVPQIALWPVFLLIPGLSGKGLIRNVDRGLSGLLLLNNLLLAGGGVAGSSYLKMKQLDKPFTALAHTSGPGEYWAYRNDAPHVDQFSGHDGIIICGLVEPPPGPMPPGGFPVGINTLNKTEATLFKGSCSAGPPLGNIGRSPR